MSMIMAQCCQERAFDGLVCLHHHAQVRHALLDRFIDQDLVLPDQQVQVFHTPLRRKRRQRRMRQSHPAFDFGLDERQQQHRVVHSGGIIVERMSGPVGSSSTFPDHPAPASNSTSAARRVCLNSIT
ncbi:MAG: hypothetical protein M3336_02085 [Chloroflexota bacterium]|nr:hypothetical protein [Chloroflexota bacterium]